ncbi:SurA N-terminal domain-containing protein [Ammoniphilus sp. 3BR4]|uniref:SurA N-terminal domain-containing protein n=1 Tax=Ammoniphilus sp. 3BR4 TaxID=3158265 RepID=UPI003467D4B4
MKVVFNKWLLSFLTLCVIIVGIAVVQDSMMSKEASASIGNSKTAAIVNGESIKKEQLLEELYKLEGERVLDGLINKKLLEQEAKKSNIQATEEEINKELDKIKSELGENYNNALTESQITESELKDNLAFNIVQKKMFSDKVTVSDEEVNQYLAQLPPDGQANQKEMVKEYLQSAKIQQEAQKWLEEARSKAQIQINIKN